MKTVEFTEDFANKVKGDLFKCDNMLASHLVNIDKVATYADDKVESEIETKSKKSKK